MAETTHDPDEPATRGLFVNGSLTIPIDELTVLVSTPGGAGGQHANRTASRVEVRFSVLDSKSLSNDQRRRLLAYYGPVVAAQSAQSRSQAHNKTLAMGVLAERLAEGIVPRPPRRATMPTLASRRRRVQTKRFQGAKKRDRHVRPDTAD